MPNSQLLDCFQPAPGLLDRVNYFPRQLLTADDMVADQRYFRQKFRRHNRFLHGWGVVCGMEVEPASIPAMPWQVQISGGYALSPYGDEIYVPETVTLDLAQCGPGTTTDPCIPDRLRRPDSSAVGRSLYIAIKYAECVARPVRVMPVDCACDETACEYSRIRDSFQIECLTELPPSHQLVPAGPSLCDFINEPQLVPCLPCPPDDWVVLAQVDLPASPATDIAAAQIHNAVRRQLFSTAVLQEMLIACCCEVNEADIVVTKSETHESSDDGQIHTITYTIEVRNDGPAIAQNIIVTDTLVVADGEIASVSDFMASQGSWTNTEFSAVSPQAQFVAEIPQLTAGTEAILGFIAVIRGQTITNTAAAQSDTFDPDTDNNSDFVIITPLDVVNPNN